MAVRAKFRVTKIERNHWQKTAAGITLEAQYDTSIPEDVRYAKATPTGKLEIYVSNPAAVEQFELGKAFYLDFTPVPEDKQGNTIAG